ncbi:MAG: DUF4430 domain-containing protein [Oscillospiraceae bacterium]|nr:DUF4430 domain-containing protein [Oscillospiraceae bacterium]
MKTKIILTLLLALVLTFAVVGCDTATPAPAETTPAVGGVQAIGQGDTVFRFVVTDPDENFNAWDVSTNEETVGAALVAVGLISGDDSEWGLMVTEVNGVTADFSVNSAFWAFYVDGDFAMAGVDATYIEPGVTYAFVYTIG